MGVRLTLTPAALSKTDAQRYLGTTKVAFELLEKAGHLAPLPVLGSYALEDLDDVVKRLRARAVRPNNETEGQRLGSTGTCGRQSLVSIRKDRGNSPRKTRRKAAPPLVSESEQAPGAHLTLLHGDGLPTDARTQVSEVARDGQMDDDEAHLP
jgi:hypothetical protein